jgi:hypothetical protein
MPIPLRGDRSAWDTIGYSHLHARDIENGQPLFHLPGGAQADQVPQWDGNKWVAVDPPSGGELEPHHIAHEYGGDDAINVTGLSGLLADPQTPVVHSHSDPWTGGVIEAEHLSSGQGGEEGYNLISDGNGFCYWKEPRRFVPVPATYLYDSQGLSFTGAGRSTGTYIFRRQENNNLWPTNAVALSVLMLARWSTANNGYLFSLRQSETEYNAVQVRALSATSGYTMNGIIALDMTYSRFVGVIEGANAASAVLLVNGYFI